MHATTARLIRIGLFSALLATLLLAVACTDRDAGSPAGGEASRQGEPASAPAPAVQPASVPAGQPGGAGAQQAMVSGLLKVEPSGGFAGDSFTIQGESFPPGAAVQFTWVTWEGSYATEIHEQGATFLGPRYAEARRVLGSTVADASGRVAATFEAPADYGGAHDIFAAVEGQDTHRGGFQLRRRVTVSPEEGPVGTPITITIEGMDRFAFGRQMAVRYNNSYTGFMTGVTNGGTATVVLRATGPVGVHTIELSGGGIHAGGFLTNHQSPYAALYPPTGSYRFHFRVTGDPGPSEAYLEWPEASRVAVIADGEPFPTAAGVADPPGLGFEMTPRGGPIGTAIEVRLSGLPASEAVSLEWATVGGSGGGQAVLAADSIPLGEHRTNSAGSLDVRFEVPNQLGGWHAVQVLSGGQVIAERGFYVERSLVGIAPKQVRQGEAFSVELIGGGFYDLDNGFAVTYDNAYIGYGCGFTARGPVTFHMVATGHLGTHFIDIYPMTYRGVGSPGEDPWGYQMPHLNALEDHPGLGLGMRLPIVRLAIEVIE